MNERVLRTPKRVRIDTAGKWRQYAVGASWGLGKPLTELAERWTASDLEEVDALLATRAGTSGFVCVEGWIGLRDLDLLVAGAAPGGATLLAALPLADEPLGDNVEEAVVRWSATRRHGEPAPAERMSQLVFGVPHQAVRTLPFRLLSATAALVGEAQARGAQQAVLVVHELRSPLTPPQLIADQVTAVDEFVRRLSLGSADAAQPGRLAGPLRQKTGVALYLGRALHQR